MPRVPTCQAQGGAGRVVRRVSGPVCATDAAPRAWWARGAYGDVARLRRWASWREMMDVLTVPQLAIPTVHEAVILVNAWLHREVGMAVHATTAHFDPTTFCWHLPIELAYATHGTLGVVGDVYLHAATGAFVGRPSAADLIRRAERLAAACGIDGC